MSKSIHQKFAFKLRKFLPRRLKPNIEMVEVDEDEWQWVINIHRHPTLLSQHRPYFVAQLWNEDGRWKLGGELGNLSEEFEIGYSDEEIIKAAKLR